MENNELVQVETMQITEMPLDKEVDVQVTTAKRFPRQVRRSIDNALAIATLDEETAEACGYAVPRAGKSIEGPSVHLARIAMQSWGNCRAESRVVQITDKHVVSEGVFWDLENNIAVKCTVQRSILNKEKKRFSDDMITVTGNAANSIALRNAIFNGIPHNVINKLYTETRAYLKKELSDESKLNTKRIKAIKGVWDNYGIKEDRVLATLNVSSVNQINAEKMIEFTSILQGIVNGDNSPEAAFPATAKENVKSKSDAAKSQI